MKIQIIDRFSYYLDKTENTIEVSEAELKQIGITKQFDVENQKIIDYVKPQPSIEVLKEIYRSQRQELLQKFDIYRSLVTYGEITETESEHQTIHDWYQALLNITETLDDTPLKEVPAIILKY